MEDVCMDATGTHSVIHKEHLIIGNNDKHKGPKNENSTLLKTPIVTRSLSELPADTRTPHRQANPLLFISIKMMK